MMTNRDNAVIYIGVTNDLDRRVREHKSGATKGFTQKYNINKLVYFESSHDAYSAIAREKQLKAGSRRKKLELINAVNPDWNDLFVAEIASLRSQ